MVKISCESTVFFAPATKYKDKIQVIYIYYIYICIHMVTDALLQKVDLVGE